MSDTGSAIRASKVSSLTPWLLGLATTVAFSALTFAWNVKTDMVLLKAQQLVSPVEFAMLKSDVEHLREKAVETHEANEKEFERLRSWMRGHRHGGTVPASVEPPAPAER